MLSVMEAAYGCVASITKSKAVSDSICVISATGSRLAETVRLSAAGSSVSPYSVATQAVTSTGWESKKATISRPSVVPAKTHILYIVIPSRRYHIL